MVLGSCPMYEMTLMVHRLSTNLTDMASLCFIATALRYTDDGGKILNSNWSLDWSGVYNAAGTTIRYRKRRHKGVGENIFVEGPTEKKIQLLLLSQTKNPGIFYEYIIPLKRANQTLNLESSQPIEISPYGYDTESMEEIYMRGRDNLRHMGRALGEQQATPISSRSRLLFTQLNRGMAQSAIAKLVGNQREENSENLAHAFSQLNEVATLPEEMAELFSNKANQTLGVAANGSTRYQPIESLQAESGGGASRHYEWQLVKSGCSETCGEGVQHIRVVCVLIPTQVTVTDENCQSMRKPRARKIEACNIQPCVTEWVAGDWSTCSATCGQSTQTRRVECKKRLSTAKYINVYAMNCDRSSRPSTVRMCSKRDCYNWAESKWSTCSAECGAGHRSRSVKCTDFNQNRVDDDLCTAERPRTEEKCYTACEKSWFYSEWSSDCSEGCSARSRSRRIYCPADEDNSSVQSACGSKPITEQQCEQTDECKVKGIWFAGEWSMCVGDCDRAFQTREVVCMTQRGYWNVVTHDDQCSANMKPDSKRKCRQESCDKTGSTWFTTSWSECSASCGHGHHRREVKCLDRKFISRADCNEVARPRTAKACSLSACPEMEQQQIVADVGSDPSCKDNYGTCSLVVQARLCRLNYYQQLCCASCQRKSE